MPTPMKPKVFDEARCRAGLAGKSAAELIEFLVAQRRKDCDHYNELRAMRERVRDLNRLAAASRKAESSAKKLQSIWEKRAKQLERQAHGEEA